MTDTVEAFLARGGEITKCKPGVAGYGYTPQSRELGNSILPEYLREPEKPASYRDGVSAFYRKTAKETDTKAFNAAHRKVAKITAEQRRRNYLDRLRRIYDWRYKDKLSAREIGMKEGCKAERVRDLLRLALEEFGISRG